ncbi:MAG: lytic murein transglycosylase [Candidatus Zambryskibacteria bacterium]|nr:lytic murein transglycosylase [Candidatus Zambryskibacteria bacterium]
MKKLLTFLIALLVAVLPIVATAQSACTAETSGKSRAQLEAELEQCNREIEEWTQTLNQTREQSASFARDVAALTAKINAAQANIKAKNIAISNLSKDIAVKESKITVLNNRIETGKRAIADILRKTNDINSYSLVEVALSGENISDFFVDIDTYASTENALENLFAELRETRSLTEAEKAALNKKKEEESAARALLEASKKQVERDQAEKKTLLAVSKNNEKTYAQVLADKQAKAAQIRSVLFPLRDAGAIPFGTALEYAEAASNKTGVSSALILAILQQESNLGANVGSCVITNLSSGETRSIRNGTIFRNGIHPARDLPILQSILNKLGGDPFQTKVSCPLSIGYGGAMGPAQFIPSTWSLMEDKVGAALGKATPNPWNPQDAIMAMALFLKDIIGNTGDSYIDQRTAACRYYSGQTCYVGGRTGRGLSYGNQVMSRVSTIQRDIDFLQGV